LQVCNVLFLFAFLSSYMPSIQYQVSTDQRKYSRPHRLDLTHYDLGRNGIPFINCKKSS